MLSILKKLNSISSQIKRKNKCEQNYIKLNLERLKHEIVRIYMCPASIYIYVYTHYIYYIPMSMS